MSIVYSSPKHSIVVLRQADGSLLWSGRYYGMDIKAAVPTDDGKRCILLLDPDARQRSVFENLLCIDQEGSVIWTAKLPDRPDCFVAIDPREEGIWANSWSCFRVLIDKNSGAELERIFTK
jgi:hypothetical protein